MTNDSALALPGGYTVRSRRWWIVALVLAVLAAVLIGYWAFGGKKDSAGDAAAGKGAQIPTVTVSTPGRGNVARVVSSTGSLAARVDMPVGVAGDGGMVRQVLVQPGDWVRAGQLLARIDRAVQVQTAASLSAQIRVAQADASLAQNELDRASQLVDRGFISKADLDRKSAARDAALARVRVAQAQFSESLARTGRLDIRAPAAGLVLTRSVEPGQVVGPGSGTLFRIAKDGEMELRATMAETDLAAVPVGASATVTPVGTDKHFAGVVWQRSPVIDPQTRQGVARISLHYAADLRPGGFASAEITSGVTQIPVLPQSAVQSDDKGNYVFIVNNKDMVVRQAITVGQVTDNGVSIANGLTGNERVVVSAGAFLNPGQKVHPVLQKTQG